MSLRAVDSSVQQPMMQGNTRSEGRYSRWTPNISSIVSNVNKVAIPLVAFLMLSEFTGADAGPLAYTACIEVTCGAGAAVSFPPWLLACLSGCIPLLAAPTP
tara:strand:- start:27 stop:332 length:306 start_codon:yes stop_codon:yes gene_type:complete